ncbi:Hypothetical predicted protein [Marmota monax]|uniref:Uncharacterized protein n=1 Tax=Marmota monax TaxID=9995 RepID=A0A5E4AJE2_MARMO|nr:Hypothetical predicted protein [Marmota monax]
MKPLIIGSAQKEHQQLSFGAWNICLFVRCFALSILRILEWSPEVQVIDLVAAPKPWRRLYLPEDDQFRGSVTTIDLDSENLNSFNIWKRGHLVYQAVHKRSFNRPDWY